MPLYYNNHVSIVNIVNIGINIDNIDIVNIVNIGKSILLALINSFLGPVCYQFQNAKLIDQLDGLFENKYRFAHIHYFNFRL